MCTYSRIKFVIDEHDEYTKVDFLRAIYNSKLFSCTRNGDNGCSTFNV